MWPTDKYPKQIFSLCTLAYLLKHGSELIILKTSSIIKQIFFNLNQKIASESKEIIKIHNKLFWIKNKKLIIFKFCLLLVPVFFFWEQFEKNHPQIILVVKIKMNWKEHFETRMYVRFEISTDIIEINYLFEFQKSNIFIRQSENIVFNVFHEYGKDTENNSDFSHLLQHLTECSVFFQLKTHHYLSRHNINFWIFNYNI